MANWLWGKAETHAVDMFLPVSQSVALATRLAEHKLPYRVIPNFVSDTLDTLQDDDDDPLVEGLPRGEYVLFVGDMGRGKGEEVLLQAYTGMENPQVPLVLIGRAAHDALASRSPSVVVLPGWPHASVMRAWSRCTIAVVPSTSFDSCPTVALEAMAMGRPVVASYIGGLPDIVVDGETGLLVPPGDSSVLQQALERLLAEPALRERMGKRARQRVVQFQARSVVPRIEEVYREVVRS
jgi:glycosyltransferase involved in cell wall biosynthesis